MEKIIEEVEIMKEKAIASSKIFRDKWIGESNKELVRGCDTSYVVECAKINAYEEVLEVLKKKRKDV